MNVIPKISKLALEIKDLFVISLDQIINLGVISIIQVHKSVLHKMDHLAFNLVQDGTRPLINLQLHQANKLKHQKKMDHIVSLTMDRIVIMIISKVAILLMALTAQPMMK